MRYPDPPETPMIRLGICLPHLRMGGIEKGLVALLAPLMAQGIVVTLYLQRAEGVLLSQVPDKVRVVDCDAGGVWMTSRALATDLRDNPADILLAATNALNIAVLLAARRLGRRAPRVVLGEHIPIAAFLKTRKRPWLRRGLMRWLYPRAAALVAPCAPLIDEHRALLGARCPVGVVLPNPVTDRIAPDRPLPQRARHCVSLGRLAPEKDFALAIQAFAHVVARDPKARLTIYGDGPQRSALEALVNALNLNGQVTLPGHTGDVAAALAAADLYLCTSALEGFGNAIVEAQAAGVPVVSVDCPFGPRLLLRGGDAGLLVTSRDAAELGHAITLFATDARARSAAAMEGRKVAQGYTIDASVYAHVAFLRQIMAGSVEDDFRR